MNNRGDRHYICIADHRICLQFSPGNSNTMGLLPSFAPFADDGQSQQPLLFTLTIDDNIKPAKDKKLVRKFDTGNGDTVVSKLPDGGYQYIIRDINGSDCCLLICDKQFNNCRCALHGDWTMRSFGLNNALMLVYAFSGSFHHTLLIHASATMLPPVAEGLPPRGFPFIAESGTGKSTHTSLWLKHIENAQLLNDDNPIVRIVNDKPFIYGSPWSGKTSCYRKCKAQLEAITQIERAKENSIEKLSPVTAMATLIPACSCMKWDPVINDNVCNTIIRIIETTPVYTLHCLPNKEAALLSFNTLALK